MSWTKKHLNWTMGITWFLVYTILLALGLAMEMVVVLQDWGLVVYTPALLVALWVAVWCLREKGRSTWWILLAPLSVWFLKNLREVE